MTDSQPLNIIIVGAGIGGLVAAISIRRQGHHVKILEQSTLANEVGAAISVLPNADSALKNIGVSVADCRANLCKEMRVFRFTGDLLSVKDIDQEAHRWQGEWRCAHRGHLHSLLKTIATSQDGVGPPVKLRSASKIVDIDPHKASVTLADGSMETADLIVGADGVRSVTRLAVKSTAAPFRSNEAVFRFVVTKEQALRDPNIASLVTEPVSMDMWYGEQGKMIIYPCANSELLNVGCVHPAHLSTSLDGYDTAGNKSQMLEIYKSFAPQAQSLLELADPSNLKVYPLYDMEKLPTFVNDRLALVGDAAHPFLPHLAQGGAQAIEDGVSLGVMLSRGTLPHEVPARLELYNKARYERASTIQEYTRMVGQDKVKNDDSGDTGLSVHKFVEYGLSHDEYHASNSLLRRYLWEHSPGSYWCQPTSFGPTPNPRYNSSNNAYRGMPVGKCRKATIGFKTSATLLQDLLPSESFRFKLKDTTAYANLILRSFKNVHWLGGRGYNSLSFYIHGVEETRASGKAVDGKYLAVTFEDCPDSIVFGREELGLPNVFSEIDIQAEHDTLRASLSWRGKVWGKLTLPALQEQHAAINGITPTKRQQDITEENVLVNTQGSGSGEQQSADMNGSCVLQQETVLSRQSCTAPATVLFDPLDSLQLPTLHRIASRLAELPIFKIVEASVVESSRNSASISAVKSK